MDNSYDEEMKVDPIRIQFAYAQVAKEVLAKE